MMVFIELWDCTHTEGQNKQKAVSVILHSPLVNFIPLTINPNQYQPCRSSRLEAVTCDSVTRNRGSAWDTPGSSWDISTERFFLIRLKRTVSSSTNYSINDRAVGEVDGHSKAYMDST